MSACSTPIDMQKRLRGAIAALAERFGCAQVAVLCGIDESTVRRHLKGTPWNDCEIAALVAAEVQKCGKSSLIEAMAIEQPAGDAARLHGDLVEDLREEGELVQAEAAALAQPTTRTLRRVAEIRRQHRTHEAQLDADLAMAQRRTA